MDVTRRRTLGRRNGDGTPTVLALPKKEISFRVIVFEIFVYGGARRKHELHTRSLRSAYAYPILGTAILGHVMSQ